MTKYRLALAASVLFGVAPPAFAQVETEQIAGPSMDAAVFALSGVGGFQQGHAARKAIDQTLRGRFQLPGASGTGDAVTRSDLFVSTQGNSGAAHEANAWLAFSGASYFDGYEGYSADLSAGMDWRLGQSGVLGLMLGAGKTDLEDSVSPETGTSSYTVGAYAAHAFASGVVIDGYLAHSALDYEVGAAAFDTTRTQAGFSVSGAVAMSTGVLQPRMRLSGSWEDFPLGVGGVTGGTTEQFIGSVGARHAFNATVMAGGLTPWASFDLEYGHQEDTTGVIDYFLSPRVGLGVTGDLGAGVLSTSIDIGYVRSDVYGVGIEMSYGFSF